MDPEEKHPLHKRVLGHIVYRAQVCDGWCREARMYDRILPAAFLGGVLLFLVYFVTIAAPLSFPTASLINIPQNASVKQVGEELQAKHIVHSALLFEVAQRIYSGNGPIIAGEYFFPGPQSVLRVAARLSLGDHELIPVRVTVPEGATAKEISQLLAQKVPDFDSATFLTLAQPEEGTLFPDTYFFLPGQDASLALEAFENNFQQHIAEPQVAAATAKFGKPLPQVLIMASILEKEGATTQDREMISGILWKRISIGMDLQVDAVFPYIIGVNSLQLTKADLATTSPYNTYTHKGLPPGPISNPSLDAIMAAVQPTKTNDLYYLSDLQGNMHFCATYTCQMANERKYLGD